jgi:hypothetical protein
MCLRYAVNSLNVQLVQRVCLLRATITNCVIQASFSVHYIPYFTLVQ